MPTESEIAAGAAALVRYALGTFELQPFVDDKGNRICEPFTPNVRAREAAKDVLAAAEVARTADRLANCKHPNARGSGTISSDGSGQTTWHCPECGKSFETKYGPRDTGHLGYVHWE